MKIIAVQDYLKQAGIKLSCENFAGELKFGDFIFYRDKRDLLVGKVVGTPRNAPDSIKVNDGKIEKVMTKEEIISQEKIQNGEKERVIKAQNSANKVKLAMKFFASKVSKYERYLSNHSLAISLSFLFSISSSKSTTCGFFFIESVNKPPLSYPT